MGTDDAQVIDNLVFRSGQHGLQVQRTVMPMALHQDVLRQLAHFIIKFSAACAGEIRYAERDFPDCLRVEVALGSAVFRSFRSRKLVTDIKRGRECAALQPV